MFEIYNEFLTYFIHSFLRYKYNRYIYLNNINQLIYIKIKLILKNKFKYLKEIKTFI